MNFCSHLISISIVVWILGTTVVAANTESKAIDLDDSTFATTIREYSLALVKFYAPWCGHCKNLAPIYDEAAEILQDSSIVLIRVNAEENSKLAREYNVSGYPTLLIFRNGIAEPYEGPRDSGQQIADFLKAETEPVSEVLPSAQFLNEIRKKYQSTTTLLIGLLTNHSDKIVFDQVLRKIKFFKGFYTTSIEVMNDLGYYSEKSTVLTFQMKSNSKRVVFRNKLSFQSLLTHVINAGMPRLYVLQPEHANLIRLWEKENPNSVVVHVYVSVESTNPELDASIIPKIDEMTQGWTHLGKGESRVNQLVVIPTDITEFSAHTFNFSKSDIASYHAATLHADQQIYSLPTGIELKDFYSAFLEKRLRPHIKSQPIPQDIAEKGKVVEVVGLTFEHLVQDPEKNVLIEFYAPWCGHCKALEPKYNQVAQMLADEEDVRVARIDATNNEVPKALQSRYHFTGFPTIFWVPRGESKNLVKTYEGSRTAEEIVAWILQNLKNKSST